MIFLLIFTLSERKRVKKIIIMIKDVNPLSNLMDFNLHYE